MVKCEQPDESRVLSSNELTILLEPQTSPEFLTRPKGFTLNWKMLLQAKKLITLFLLLVMPASASSFMGMDFLNNIFGNEEPQSSSANSQVMPILSAPQNINPSAGRGGGDISIVQGSALLPVSGPLGSIADIEERKPDTISLYVVRPGDTMYTIASLFGVSVNTIRWANDLERTSIITPGQVLVILPISGLQYTAKKGDTLKSIAKKFGGDAEEIADFNGLALEGTLEAGASLIIPNGEAGIIASVPPPKKSAGGTAAGRGYYLRPFMGGVRTQGIHGYNGVDLASSCGTPIVAAATGDVILTKSSGWNAGYGHYVTISHPNGTQTLYAHLSGLEVGRGWHVVQGQLIGYMGSTGLSTGCHLHFEVRGGRNPF